MIGEPGETPAPQLGNQQKIMLRGPEKSGSRGGNNWRKGARFFEAQMDIQRESRALAHIRDCNVSCHEVTKSDFW